MITNAKKPENTNKVILQAISFLNQDGVLTVENYLLSEDKKYFVSENDWQKFGKVEKFSDGTENHYLKRFRGGRPGEILINPYAMLAKPSDLSAFATQRGERFCEYVKVKADIFDSYKTFLSTRNSRFFDGAEKAIKDGDNE